SAWNSARSGLMRGVTGGGSAVAEAAEEARVVAGVAGAATFLLDLEQQRVAVAVVVGLAHVLRLAAGVALAPQLLAAAAPVDHPPLGEGAGEALGVHPRHH